MRQVRMVVGMRCDPFQETQYRRRVGENQPGGGVASLTRDRFGAELPSQLHFESVGAHGSPGMFV